jgi:hypothetical protein
VLYTASYFETQNHHGQLISISRSRPKNFTHLPTLDFFTPSQELLDFWHKRTKTAQLEEISALWEQYQSGFFKLIDTRMSQIEEWISTLNPSQDYTLCCWEKTTDKIPNCHRNDVGGLLSAMAPELWGGFDVPALRYEKGQWVRSVHSGAIGQIDEARYLGDTLCYRVKITSPPKRITWLFAKDMVPSVKPQANKPVKQVAQEQEREIEFVQLGLM